ncbi:type IV pilus modification protein PilV [Crenobacter cavernae]|uniref:type IV pilus modification protein PilV n=1 Tax=Crenobacter cavernae TaxID=2290923 RepID=UPI0015F19D62|nr:type IV pilus modification protein PilV [Crenobacter cavernae]
MTSAEPFSVQRGFTLLEVLVALFVLGFGLLALAAVQLRTYSTTREAEYQSIAALHAEGLAEAMRANPKRTGVASEPWQWSHYVESTPGSAATAPSQTCSNYDATTQAFGSGSQNCNQNQVAAYDLYLFKSRLESAFPQAQEVKATVCPTNDLSVAPTLSALACDVSGALAIKIVWRAKIGREVNRQMSGDANASATRQMFYQVRFSP